MKWRCQTSTNSTRARSSSRKNACRDPASRASSRWRPTRPPSPRINPSTPPLTNTWRTTSTATRWDRSAPCWGWRPSTLTPTRKTATRLRSSRWRGALWLKTMTRRYLIAPTDVTTYRPTLCVCRFQLLLCFDRINRRYNLSDDTRCKMSRQTAQRYIETGPLYYCRQHVIYACFSVIILLEKIMYLMDLFKTYFVPINGYDIGLLIN